MKTELLVMRVYEVMPLIDENPDDAAQMLGWVTAAVSGKALPPTVTQGELNRISDIIGRMRTTRRRDRLAVIAGVTEIVETFARSMFQRPPSKRQRKAA